MPYPEPLSLRQATAHPYLCRRHSNTGRALCGVSGSWCTQGLFEPSERLWRVWDLILNVILPLLQSCWGFSFALGQRVSSLVGSNILLLMVVQQRVVVLEFSPEKGARPSTPSCHVIA